MGKKIVVNKIDLDALKVGQHVSYGFYADVIYKGINKGGEVVMEDRLGNTKCVYKELFCENAKLIT